MVEDIELWKYAHWAVVVFHLALVVSAALQVHQTKSALVTVGDDCGPEISFEVRDIL